MSPLPRVAVIFTGGTISMTVDPAAGGAVPTLAGAELLAAVPGLARRADVVPIDLGRIPASHLSFADVLRDPRASSTARCGPGAFAASWSSRAPTRSRRRPSPGTSAIADPRPVVVTGAMRNASEPGWDGPANLLRRRAGRRRGGGPRRRGARRHGRAGPRGRRRRQAPCLGRRRVRDARGSAARAGGGGRRPASGPADPRRTLPATPAAAAMPVPIIVAALETTGAALDAAVRDGARGVVVAATGSGNTHPDLLRAAVDARAAGVAVVLASRTGRRGRRARLRVSRAGGRPGCAPGSPSRAT